MLLQVTETPSEQDGDSAAVRMGIARPNSFAILYERYVDVVYGYCLNGLHDRSEAEDAAALTFTRAFEALPGYRFDRGSFRSWLFTIAHHTVVNTHRGRRDHRPIDGILQFPSRQPGLDAEATRSDEPARLIGHFSTSMFITFGFVEDYSTFDDLAATLSSPSSTFPLPTGPPVVWDIRVQPDGRVTAKMDTNGNGLFVTLVQNNGRWLIDEMVNDVIIEPAPKQ